MFICLCEATIHYDTGQHLQNCVGVKINKGLYQMSTICICPSTANSKFLSSDKTYIFPLCSIVICPCTIHHKSGFPTRQPLILTFSFIFFGLNPSWRLNCVNFSDHNMSHFVIVILSLFTKTQCYYNYMVLLMCKHFAYCRFF